MARVSEIVRSRTLLAGVCMCVILGTVYFANWGWFVHVDVHPLLRSVTGARAPQAGRRPVAPNAEAPGHHGGGHATGGGTGRVGEGAEALRHTDWPPPTPPFTSDSIDWSKPIRLEHRRPIVFSIIYGQTIPLGTTWCATLLTASAYSHGVVPDVMGLTPLFDHHGLFPKLLYEREYFSKLHPHDFVVFLDGKDVVSNRPLDDLYEHFLTFDANIVLSMEPACFPRKPHCDTQRLEVAEHHAEWAPHKYINTGLLMGYAGAFNYSTNRILEYSLELEREGVVEDRTSMTGGDQYWWGRALHFIREEVALNYDYNQTFAFTMNLAKQHQYVPHTADGPNMRVNRTGVRPYFQHFNSNNKKQMLRQMATLDLFHRPQPAEVLRARERISGYTLEELCCPPGREYCEVREMVESASAIAASMRSGDEG